MVCKTSDVYLNSCVLTGERACIEVVPNVPNVPAAVSALLLQALLACWDRSPCFYHTQRHHY